MSVLKIMSIVGARPNFIKIFPIINSLKNMSHSHLIVHTGQHYDINMSDIFFQEMNVKQPDYNLGVGSASHGIQTGEILKRIDKVLRKENPDVVLVPGDTNSTLGGALAATKQHIKVAHLEAGLRSFDKKMPEEINRILTDHCSDILFCPTKIAIRNLGNEGITENVHLVGDTMFEIAKRVEKRVEEIEPPIDLSNKFVLCTIHRAKNTTDRKLPLIIKELTKCNYNIVMPLHPRTRNKLKKLKLLKEAKKYLTIIEPVGYLEFTKLIQKSIGIITDSGGVQKEAYWNKKPCVTVRDTTEWIETIEAGGNILVKPGEICEKLESMLSKNIKFDKGLYGYKDTSKRIIGILENFLQE